MICSINLALAHQDCNDNKMTVLAVAAMILTSENNLSVS